MFKQLSKNYFSSFFPNNINIHTILTIISKYNFLNEEKPMKSPSNGKFFSY